MLIVIPMIVKPGLRFTKTIGGQTNVDCYTDDRQTGVTF